MNEKNENEEIEDSASSKPLSDRIYDKYAYQIMIASFVLGTIFVSYYLLSLPQFALLYFGFMDEEAYLKSTGTVTPSGFYGMSVPTFILAMIVGFVLALFLGWCFGMLGLLLLMSLWTSTEDKLTKLKSVNSISEAIEILLIPGLITIVIVYWLCR